MMAKLIIEQGCFAINQFPLSSHISLVTNNASAGASISIIHQQSNLSKTQWSNPKIISIITRSIKNLRLALAFFPGPQLH
jgi:hypothetical protein